MIMLVQQAKQPFHIIVKPRGPICNLACDYCYYLPKKNRTPQSYFHMTLDLLADFTRQMIAAQPAQTVTFTWQGGEPTLMGLDFFREAIRLQEQFIPAGTQVKNILQTNGTLLNHEWCHFFKEHNFLIGLSLDGPSGLHDAYRHDSAGQGSFNATMRGLRLLQEYNVQFNILCCVHQANVRYPVKVYRFLRDEAQAQFIQFIPILQRQVDKDGQETADITDLSVTGEGFGEFLIAVFDEWARRDVGKVFVQHFDLALGAWAGQPSSLCVFAETCGRALVLEHNGDLYACDHFVDDDHLLGNMTHTPLVHMVNSAEQRQFGQSKKEDLPENCLDCSYRFACNGGCPKNRDKNGLNRLCAGYQAYFNHINPAMEKMTALLRQNRPPAEIMSHYQQTQE